MRRGAILGAVLAVVAITALWWVFIVGPSNSEVTDIETEVENERTREGTLRQQIANLQSLKDLEVSYLFAIGQMEAAIPEFPEVDTFLEEVNFLAHRTGVDLSAWSLATPIEPPEGVDGPLIIPISLNATGQYFEVLGFLYGLEAMERLVRVEGVGLTPIETEADDESGPEGEDVSQPDLSEGPRPRPDITTLQATITGAIFTQTPVAVEVPVEGEDGEGGEEEPSEDEPSEGENGGEGE